MPVKKPPAKKKPAKKASIKKATTKKTPAKKETKKLTPKQETFKNLLLKGVSHIDAYNIAYDTGNMTKRNAQKEADKLAGHPLITPLIEKARKKALDKAVCSLEWVVARLMHEATLTGVDPLSISRLNALKQLGEYTGGFDANKKQIDLTSSDGSMTPVKEGMEAFYEDQEKESK